MRAEQVTDRDLFQAAHDIGLTIDPEEIVWEVVPNDVIFRVAAYGFPRNYPHWSFGREYWIRRSEQDRGRAKLYEIFLKDQPSVAYLSEDNSPVERLLVKAHCLGHAWLARRNRTNLAYMPDGMIRRAAMARERVLQYEARYGPRIVERVIDHAHALRATVTLEPALKDAVPDRAEWSSGVRLAEIPYADLMSERDVVAAAEREERQLRALWAQKWLGVGQHDLLLWLITYANVPEWQRDILTVVREQALYQMGIRWTKILHESFAAYVHLKILRALDLDTEDAVSWALTHAGIAWESPLILNPYSVALKLFEVLERRGEDVFNIVQGEDDASLFRNWFDEEVAEESRLYRWREDRTKRRPPGLIAAVRERQHWERLRDELVRSIEERNQESLPVEVASVSVELRETPPLSHGRFIDETLELLGRANIRVSRPGIVLVARAGRQVQLVKDEAQPLVRALSQFLASSVLLVVLNDQNQVEDTFSVERGAQAWL